MKIKWKEVAVFCGAIFLPMIIIRILFIIPAPCEFFDPEWGEGEVLTYISTMVLSWIAVYQNKKVNDINKHMLKINEDMLNVEDRSLHIEESKITPSMAIFDLSDEDETKYPLTHSLRATIGGEWQALHITPDGKLEIYCDYVFRFLLKNVSGADAIRIALFRMTILYLDQDRNCLKTEDYDVSNDLSDHAMQAKQGIRFYLGTSELWPILYDLNGHLLKFIFIFDIQGADGTEYEQQIELEVINTPMLLPMILTQKIEKPKRKGVENGKAENAQC